MVGIGIGVSRVGTGTAPLLASLVPGTQLSAMSVSTCQKSISKRLKSPFCCWVLLIVDQKTLESTVTVRESVMCQMTQSQSTTEQVTGIQPLLLSTLAVVGVTMVTCEQRDAVPVPVSAVLVSDGSRSCRTAVSTAG